MHVSVVLCGVSMRDDSQELGPDSSLLDPIVLRARACVCVCVCVYVRVCWGEVLTRRRFEMDFDCDME